MNAPAVSPVPDHKRYFFEKFGITERLLERCLGEALSAGGDYADLYFESVTAISLGVDEQIVKSASQGTSAGCGIRVLSGERTGYAYTDNLSPERLLHAARTAALIASGPAKQPHSGISGCAAGGSLSGAPRRIRSGPGGAAGPDFARGSRGAGVLIRMCAGAVELFRRAAADFDCGSDGAFASDTQPLCRLNVFVIAKDVAEHDAGSAGCGGRGGLEQFVGSKSPENLAREAARGAILQLGAVAAPAGEMEVVLGPGWPGILLHEAVGMGWKRTSIARRLRRLRIDWAAGRQPQGDGGRQRHDAGRRGSLNVDDEGSPTQETVLIENGMLKGYLTDKLSSRLTGAWPILARDGARATSASHAAHDEYLHAGRRRRAGRHYPQREAGPLCRELWRRAGGYHQRQVCLLGLRGVPDRGRRITAPVQGRNADRQWAGGAEVCVDGGA
jgi:TldD protein